MGLVPVQRPVAQAHGTVGEDIFSPVKSDGGATGAVESHKAAGLIGIEGDIALSLVGDPVTVHAQVLEVEGIRGHRIEGQRLGISLGVTGEPASPGLLMSTVVLDDGGRPIGE